MEIKKYDYVNNQRRLIIGLEEIAQTMRDMVRLLDEELSDTYMRRCSSAFSAINLCQNALCDCREELNNIDTKEE